jgi:DNA-binding transcriptional ArsR family regulator
LSMTELELLDELYRELALPALEDGEVTAQMVADYTGISWSQAMRTLKAKEQAGLLKSRQVKLPNNRVATAWSKA